MSSFKISKSFALKSSVRVMYFIILLSTLLVFNLNEKLSYFAYSLLLPHFLVKFPLKRLGLVEIMYVVFVCFSVENGEHCDFTILRNMLIR